jgi:hypothetical protein
VSVDIAALEAAHAKALMTDYADADSWLEFTNAAFAALPVLLTATKAAQTLMANMDRLGGFRPQDFEALRSALAAVTEPREEQP